MIDVATEKLLTLAQAAKHLPGRPSICTIWRWRNRGIKGRRLESVQVGGRVYTSLEALARFAASASGDQPAAPRTSSQRERAIARAERELDRAGV